MKHIRVLDCVFCPNYTLGYLTEEDEERGKKWKKLPKEDRPGKDLLSKGINPHKIGFCMESDDPPYQFILRPIDVEKGIPDWCPLEDCSDESPGPSIFKPVHIPECEVCHKKGPKQVIIDGIPHWLCEDCK